MAEISYREAVAQAMREALDEDPRVFLIGEDIGRYGGAFAVTKGFWDEYGPRRIKDSPLSESVIVGAGVGAAMAGLRPIVELMTINFSLLAMDQIVNTAAKMNYFYNGRASVPLVCRVWSGFRPSGGPQQSQSNEAMFAHVPGLKVVMPSTPYDVKGLLKASIRDDNPVIFFEPKGVYSLEGPVPDEDYVVELGIAEVKREGRDVTVIALGAMVPPALAAADNLAKDVSVEVVDPRTIRPLDVATLVKSVKKTGRAVIVHEANTTGGVGGEIAAVLADEAFGSLRAPIKRIGAMETPIPVSPALGSAVVPSERNIVDTVRALIQDTSPS